MTSVLLDSSQDGIFTYLVFMGHFTKASKRFSVQLHSYRGGRGEKNNRNLVIKVMYLIFYKSAITPTTSQGVQHHILQFNTLLQSVLPFFETFFKFVCLYVCKLHPRFLLLSATLSKRCSFMLLFILGNKKNSHGARSGKQGAWGKEVFPFLAKTLRIEIDA